MPEGRSRERQWNQKCQWEESVHGGRGEENLSPGEQATGSRSEGEYMTPKEKAERATEIM